eukprot:GFKZ01006358.1.p1 GENE.GFKZ01006358.1~~GFKZ01006358.1.p1  ORF type:complete len:108 (-),score=9.40 GFKZ01006358.1:621-944(-)
MQEGTGGGKWRMFYQHPKRMAPAEPLKIQTRRSIRFELRALNLAQMLRTWTRSHIPALHELGNLTRVVKPLIRAAMAAVHLSATSHVVEGGDNGGKNASSSEFTSQF